MTGTIYSVIAGCAIGVASFTSAQDGGVKPQVPEDAFSARELIVWSTLQEPHATPPPLPPPDKPVPQPDRQQANTDNEPSVPPHQDEAVRMFVGKIFKAGSTYVLQADNTTTYRLAGEADLSQFESKSVKVEGVLDVQSNTIHVTRITLV